MSEASEKFWERAVQSGALTASQRDRLGEGWTRRGASYRDDATSLAKWLIARGVLTTYQARILLAGKPGPFRFGDYRVVDRLRANTARHFLVAVDVESGQQVVLHFFTNSSKPANEAEAFAATQTAIREARLGVGTIRRYVDLGSYCFTVIDRPAVAASAGSAPPGSSLRAAEDPATPFPATPFPAAPLPAASLPAAELPAEPGLQIETEPHHASHTRRPRRRSRATVYGGAAAAVAILIGAATWWAMQPPSNSKETVSADPQSQPAPPPSPVAGGDRARSKEETDPAREDIVPDDGALLWASPTSDEPISIAYLPAGSQIVCAVRPRAIFAADEGPRLLAALGAWGAEVIAAMEEDLKCPLRDVDSLLIGVQSSSSSGGLLAAYVAELPGGVVEDARERWTTTAEPRRQGEQTYYRSGSEDAWFPPTPQGRTLVVCPVIGEHAWMAEIIEAAGGAPPVRRELEQLLDTSDEGRHFTLLTAPSFLFSQHNQIFRGAAERLREPLAWFLGGQVENVKAAALSLHWSDSFYLEFRAVASPELSPRDLTDGLRDRVGRIPAATEDYVLAFPQLHPHGRRVIMRLPGMLRKLVAYSRFAVDRRQAVLRCYLPLAAGHNLLMASDLALHEATTSSARKPGPASAMQPPNQPPTLTIADRLAATTSLSFDRETLEDALNLWSEDADVEIELLGSDLQLEGITKNQSFGIDLRDQPAESILVAILTAANPDKTSTGPADPNQKLIYIVQPGQAGGPGRIVITTRAQATLRGDPIPAVFQ